jgi:hypothetical protein
VLCVAIAPHGVTVPMHVDEVDCHAQPCCCVQAFSEGSCVQGVSVPLQGVAAADQLQPGVVHVAWLTS